ncbi:MAG: NAD(P)H-dependent oxidoreductase [Deltaproteobacteria bacterium]|nr:NAD(P)H-dependent oxidoreductase [Deltaproteobacteria bacterium]
MKIAILNGSPKGDLSITMQYVHFIAKKFPQHSYRTHDVAQQVHKLARDEKAFEAVMEDIRASDAVIWSFPIYAFLVPAQYKRFIELIFDRNAKKHFKNKYTVTLSTSMRFFDHTAHNYMQGICDDLDMKFCGAYSADMQDLLDEAQREKLLIFAEDLFRAVGDKRPTMKMYPPLVHSSFTYKPGPVVKKVDNRGKRILILTDLEKPKTNLGRMIQRIEAAFTGGTEVINLNDIDIKGGCLGCIQCGFDNRCVYLGKDGFIDFYDKSYRTADAVIFAPRIKDRYYSWTWKLLYDRGFYNGHTPVLKGKQILYILSGPLGQIPNLQQMIAASSEIGGANLVGIVTDESGDSKTIDALLQSGAEQMMRFDELQYVKPPSFLYVGGHKIFRDMVFGGARFVFQADYNYYRKNKMFDFPHRDKKAIAFNKKMMDLMKDPATKEEIRKMMKKEMVRPHQKVVATK